MASRLSHEYHRSGHDRITRSSRTSDHVEPEWLWSLLVVWIVRSTWERLWERLTWVPPYTRVMSLISRMVLIRVGTLGLPCRVYNRFESPRSRLWSRLVSIKLHHSNWNSYESLIIEMWRNMTWWYFTYDMGYIGAIVEVLCPVCCFYIMLIHMSLRLIIAFM